MQKYVVADPAVRRRVEAALRAIEGWTERPEQSCAYRLDFAADGERVIAKQYTNGTLLLQGQPAEGPLFERLARRIDGLVGAAPSGPAKSLRGPHPPTPSPSGRGGGGAGGEVGGAEPLDAGGGAAPTAVLNVERPGGYATPWRRHHEGAAPTAVLNVERPFETPWIGSDESGKGDYFGPLVACAVYVDERALGLLDALGVRDSKRLSDAQNRRLAGEVRAVCADRWAEVLVAPERYNALYAQFRAEGKNLNSLLSWGHVRAIGAVLDRVPCQNVIVDQFADPRYIAGRLAGRDRARRLNVVQAPRAEANLAVAAASVLARDRFLGWLERASREFGQRLPKGASAAVEAAARAFVARHGREALGRVAKLHFKTTARVLDEDERVEDRG